MQKKIEIFLLSIICICVVGISAAQIFFKTGIVAPVSESAYDDVTDYKDSTLYRQRGIIQLKISHYPEAVVLINGESPYKFKQDGEYLIYEVYDKDVVELDLRNIIDTEVVVYVAAVTSNVKFPLEDTSFVVKNGIKKLFTVSCENLSQ